MGPLLERASDLTRAAASLGVVSGDAARLALQPLLRSMNSYYSNRMEGEHTRPSDIERALLREFSADIDLARRQRLAIAHMNTEARCEKELERRLVESPDATTRWLYSSQALSWLHADLFQSLPENELKLSDGSVLVPGHLRERGVAVGRHEAPAWEALPLFLDRWAQAYGSTRRGEASLVAVAAAHHRLAWMHPFADGNGRVARLHTHLLLYAAGLTRGLWSPLRGFARSEARYKALLQAADEHRRGDLDGRGNLTQAGLIDWIQYVLEICVDQAVFMTAQLDLNSMRERIRAALAFDSAVVGSGVRNEALLPLHYLFATQAELGRADFKAMTGLGERVATSAVSALLKRGYLTSDSAYGPLRFSVPRHSLRFYFPALWPEAEQDEALVQQSASPASNGVPSGLR